ncbi:MAG: DUF1648 domain-containing protein [Dehalococcoidales bacterium]|nr:DUF1648 domain-containing protein [Dehalococcoidales bacterium]
MKKTIAGATIAFRWSYILLPLVIFLLSLAIIFFFYPRLPGEIAYHFEAGLPDRWLRRTAIVLWMLLPQLFFTLLAGAVTWGVTRLAALFKQRETPVIKPERIILIMGNMVALPQTILAFAMLDIFIYNSYRIRLLPLWLFALIVMGLGGIILGAFFISAVRRAWGISKE